MNANAQPLAVVDNKPTSDVSDLCPTLLDDTPTAPNVASTATQAPSPDHLSLFEALSVLSQSELETRFQVEEVDGSWNYTVDRPKHTDRKLSSFTWIGDINAVDPTIFDPTQLQFIPDDPKVSMNNISTESRAIGNVLELSEKEKWTDPQLCSWRADNCRRACLGVAVRETSGELQPAEPTDDSSLRLKGLCCSWAGTTDTPSVRLFYSMSGTSSHQDPDLRISSLCENAKIEGHLPPTEKSFLKTGCLTVGDTPEDNCTFPFLPIYYSNFEFTDPNLKNLHIGKTFWQPHSKPASANPEPSGSEDSPASPARLPPIVTFELLMDDLERQEAESDDSIYDPNSDESDGGGSDSRSSTSENDQEPFSTARSPSPD